VIQTEQYKIVAYTPEFKEAVLALQTHHWGPRIDLNRAYFEWKYEQNPYGHDPIIVLALHEGKVVGMRGFYGAKWEIGKDQKTFLGPCAADMVIHPEHRNRGLFAEMTEAALCAVAHTGYPYVFNLSAGSLTQINCLAMGWQALGSLQWMQRQAGKKVTGASVSFEEAPRPQAMAELIERIGSDGRVRHVRDEAYFAWRFKNPLSQYRFLFWENQGLEGYLVLHQSLKRVGEGMNIVDWEAANAQARAGLLEAAIRLAGAETLSIWGATLADESAELLRREGFDFVQSQGLSGSSSSPTVLVRATGRETWGSDLAGWDIRMIYSDGY